MTVEADPAVPFDPERGPGYIRATIRNLEEIGLSPAEQEAIFCGNVTRLTGLTASLAGVSGATTAITLTASAADADHQESTTPRHTRKGDR